MENKKQVSGERSGTGAKTGNEATPQSPPASCLMEPRPLPLLRPNSFFGLFEIFQRKFSGIFRVPVRINPVLTLYLVYVRVYIFSKRSGKYLIELGRLSIALFIQLQTSVPHFPHRPPSPKNTGRPPILSK